VSPGLTIAFSRRAAGEQAEVILEQVPWENYIGRVTKGAMVAYLQHLMYNTPLADGIVRCGITDNAYSCMVLVYPSEKLLPYVMGLSHGTVDAGIKNEQEFTETINFKLTDRAELSYPQFGIVSAQFVGPVFDSTGAAVPAPDLELNGREIRLSDQIYGAVEVIYQICVYGHTVTVPAREEAIENKYSSAVYARYPGGVKWEPLEPPPSAEEYAKLGGECGWNLSFFRVGDTGWFHIFTESRNSSDIG